MMAFKQTEQKMQKVSIKGCSFRGITFNNEIFPLFSKVVKGNEYEITIDLTNTKFSIDGKPNKTTINVNKLYLTFYDHQEETPLDGNYLGETEIETMERIRERFSIMADLVDAVSTGVVKSLIISGPPGVGKSWITFETLQSKNIFNTVSGEKDNFNVVSGGLISAIGLYQLLHDMKDEENVLVLDDVDSILYNPETLGMLKAALNSGGSRRISWNTESRILESAGLPKSFNFKGGIIFITNMDINRESKSKILAPHMDALISRSHCLNLEIFSMRDRYLRIKDIVLNSDILRNFYFDGKEIDIIMNYLRTNFQRFRSFDLRTVTKVAEIMASRSDNWQRICDITLLKNK